ncbi:unnamed protein product [marine sediment metagenome]|uniref:DUF1353 domain-containing protein n=1 Tax=marine sediment metagenome TaxID=412755 RepID=X0V9J7_9ZZZZ
MCNIKINSDFRLRKIETKTVVLEGEIYLASRTNIINKDNSIEKGEWFTNGIARKNMKKIKYTKKRIWKYKLKSFVNYNIPSEFKVAIEKAIGESQFCTPNKTMIGTDYTHYFQVTKRCIIVHEDYCWDGASGPTLDTKNTMSASLIHDVFYQCFREEILNISLRKVADQIFRHILIENGMNKIRANIWYYSLRMFGKKSADPKNFILEA